MSLKAAAQRYMPALFGNSDRPHGREILGLRPLRRSTVSWEQNGDDDLVVITVPRRREWLTNLAARMFGIPSTRRIELTDEISSYVWVCCDGNRTVSDIAEDISHRYKLNKRQSEVSVLTFLKTLQSKGLIGIPAAQASAFKHRSAQPPDADIRGSGTKKKVINAAKRRSGKFTK